MSNDEVAVIKKNDKISMLERFRLYMALIKPRQTSLLLITTVGAFIATAGYRRVDWGYLGITVLMAFFTISGTTILNMIYDRDIDAEMKRTQNRPLPTQRVSVLEARIIGTVTIVVGLLGAYYWINLVTAIVLFMGVLLDLPVYTVWLKRRHRYSIVFGGIAGGMPALAGRTAVIGRVDLLGILLVAFISTWVPVHILTLAIVYKEDYKKVGVPMWPVQVGDDATLRFIAMSSIFASIVILIAAYMFRVYWPVLVFFVLMSTVISVLCVINVFKPSINRNWTIFKLASMYMALTYLFLPLHP